MSAVATQIAELDAYHTFGRFTNRAQEELAEAVLARGVVCRAIPYANSVALSPPLSITDEEIDELVDAVGAALSDVPAST